MHSQKCEACDVLSRQDHRKEGKLISHVWDNITASETANGQYIIEHKYLYRHNPKEVYDPKQSNVKEAAGHSRKVVQKAHRQGTLHLLDEQVNKMIKKKAFIVLKEEEV